MTVTVALHNHYDLNFIVYVTEIPPFLFLDSSQYENNQKYLHPFFFQQKVLCVKRRFCLVNYNSNSLRL